MPCSVSRQIPPKINPTLVTSDLYSEIPTWHIGTHAEFKDAAIVPKSFKTEDFARK